jgi:hypothetical protein
MYNPTVTCGDYRSGRRLLSLKLQLAEDKDLESDLRAEIEAEVARLEAELDMT